jgi:hypothetical protein
VTPATRVGNPRPRDAEEPEVSASSCPAGPRTSRPTRSWTGGRRRSLVCTTADRSLIARLVAHESWARTTDPGARTEPARRALLDRFEREVDPDGVLSPAERARRAGHARKAYFTRLALRSAQARRRTPAVADENGRRERPDGDQPQ